MRFSGYYATATEVVALHEKHLALPEAAGMADNLIGLVLDALDDYNQIKDLHELLSACLDKQLDKDKMLILVDTLLSAAEPHLEEMSLSLEKIRKLVAGTSASTGE